MTGRSAGPVMADDRPVSEESRRAVGGRVTLTLVPFLGAFVADLASKWLIVTVVMLPPRDIEITPFFNLTLGFNTGVSFGMLGDVFQERPGVLAGLTMLVAAALLVWAFRTGSRLEAFALALIAGGATGNVADRARHGAVTDFLDFHLAGWHWPAFNMADVAITLGAAILVCSAIWPARPATEAS